MDVDAYKNILCDIRTSSFKIHLAILLRVFDTEGDEQFIGILEDLFD